jgi:hypothetical protein
VIDTGKNLTKRILIVFLAFACCGSALAAEPVFHKFSIWGAPSTKSDKLFLYTGFVEGLLAGASRPSGDELTPGHQLLSCLLDSDHHPDTGQAIAMIDKYFQDHPELWDASMGVGMVSALMVENGPCARRIAPEAKAKIGDNVQKEDKQTITPTADA